MKATFSDAHPALSISPSIEHPQVQCRIFTEKKNSQWTSEPAGYFQNYNFSSIVSHWIALDFIIALHCIALHCIALHCIALHCIALHCIALHCIALHCIALHCIALHCIALHCITLHCITVLHIGLDIIDWRFRSFIFTCLNFV